MHISPSQKRYIGITSIKPVTARWANGKGYSHNKYFARAIDKYGWNNFNHIIVFKDICEKDAKRIEVQLIAKYNSNNPLYGYNITAGGDGCVGVKQTRQHVEMRNRIISKPVYQFDAEYNFIREIKSIREAGRFLEKSKSPIQACCAGTLLSAYGYVWRYKSDVQNPYDKNSIWKPSNKYCNRPVYMIDILTREYLLFNCVTDIREKLDINISYIYRCCKERTHTYKGNIFVYADEVDDIDSFVRDGTNFRIGNRRLIEQFDADGHFIHRYGSISSAASSLGLNRKQIASACKNDTASYAGFIWRYA